MNVMQLTDKSGSGFEIRPYAAVGDPLRTGQVTQPIFPQKSLNNGNQ